MGTTSRRPRWGGTKKQGEDFDRLRVSQARVRELEAEIANVRKSERDMAEALARANAKIGTFNRLHEAEADPNTFLVKLTPATQHVLSELATGGFYPPTVPQTIEEIVRLHVRELIASGKVPRW